MLLDIVNPSLSWQFVVLQTFLATVFLEFPLCLSRACLGKMIVFICKWRKIAKQRANRSGLVSHLKSRAVWCTSHPWTRLSLLQSVPLLKFPYIYVSVPSLSCQRFGVLH
jgi:hypothetical protein